jgi:hypothetical protein
MIKCLCVFIYLSLRLSVNLSLRIIYVGSVYLSIDSFISLHTYLLSCPLVFLYLSIYLSLYQSKLSTYPPVFHHHTICL